jgi:hypothetical protein
VGTRHPGQRGPVPGRRPAPHGPPRRRPVDLLRRVPGRGLRAARLRRLHLPDGRAVQGDAGLDRRADGRRERGSLGQRPQPGGRDPGRHPLPWQQLLGRRVRPGRRRRREEHGGAGPDSGGHGPERDLHGAGRAGRRGRRAAALRPRGHRRRLGRPGPAARGDRDRAGGRMRRRPVPRRGGEPGTDLHGREPGVR